MSRHPSSFLSLPGEVKNIIYRHALVAKDNVHIQDMHPDQYQTTTRSHKRVRKPYQTAKILHQCSRCSCSRLKFKCHECRKTLDSFRTVYTREADHNSELSPALLRANKKVRREAHSIFYQANTFLFYSKSAVLPFLKDRTRESLANIKRHRFPSGDRSPRRARSGVPRPGAHVPRSGPHGRFAPANPQSHDRGSQVQTFVWRMVGDGRPGLGVQSHQDWRLAGAPRCVRSGQCATFPQWEVGADARRGGCECRLALVLAGA